jgi:predicted metal-binding protein
MTRVAIICCQKTKDIRGIGKDLLAAQEGTGSFAATGPAEIIGCIFCGGCCGKRV